MFERRLAALEGTRGRHRRIGSGMGAILLMGMGLLKAGDHVDLLAQHVRLDHRAVRPRVRASSASRPPSCSQTDLGAVDAPPCVPDTKLLFAESPTNPLTEVCDIRALADLAHSVGALLAVDNCFCSPALQRRWNSAPTSSCIRAPSTWTARAA